MKRILFVEDDEMSRDVITTRLQRSGFTVTALADGQLALDQLGAETYDLVILDINMPGLSGTDVVKKIRARPAIAQLPVLALSAHTMNSDRKKALEAGCNDFDSKPVNLPRLLEKIGALLGGEKVRT